MLYSAEANVAFAHYPKTAGCSISEWFRTAFPDARHALPGSPHVPVRESLQELEIIPRPRRQRGFVRTLGRLARRVPALRGVAQPHCDLRVIGVLRDPFAMAVSLYEYWRRHPFAREPDQPMVKAARTGSFRDFLVLAVHKRLLPNYERFFDVDGPAWAGTRLIEFESLDDGLHRVCDEFGLPHPRLPTLNVAPTAGRDAASYLAEAGPLAFELRTYFRWYYEAGRRCVVRSDPSPQRRAA
jgi:hypothetical protein